MEQFDNLKIIALTGLPGSGKSSAVDYLTEKGIPKVYFGGVVLNGMKKAGIEQTPENEEKYREDLRTEKGKDFIALEIIEEIKDLYHSGQHRIVADGLYSWSEYKLLKETFHRHLTVVALFCPKHLRHHRLANRPVRPLTEAQANERDYAEIEHLEKGGTIAMADFTVINDGNYEEFYAQIDDVLSQIEF